MKEKSYIACELTDKTILEFDKICNKIDTFNDGQMIAFKAEREEDNSKPFILLSIIPISQIRQIYVVHCDETIELFK
ncbi:MAG: hypothetical protein J6B01_04850 [Ruminococcus sp.]|nr:hypothetical protein [Ruminococcus sp.]MBO5319121.1 hypothetical protein [Ruminococcus sp.]